MNDYHTKDMGEAAALLTRGCRMRDVQWKDDTAYFIFPDRPQCEAIAKEYFYSDLQVSARTYYDNLRMIKRKLYAGEKGGRR